MSRDIPAQQVGSNEEATYTDCVKVIPLASANVTQYHPHHDLGPESYVMDAGALYELLLY